jgi:hypothetical protein
MNMTENKAPTGQDHGKPMTKAEQRAWTERFFNRRWPSSFEKPRAPETDDFDDCC